MDKNHWEKELNMVLVSSDIGKLKSFISSLLSRQKEEMEVKVKDMLAAHIRWSNTELSEYARGGREACEDFKALLHTPSVKEEEKESHVCRTPAKGNYPGNIGHIKMKGICGCECHKAPDDLETSN